VRHVRPVNIEVGSVEATTNRLATPFVPRSLVELVQATPEEVSRCDVALMNLLSADGLPGAEEMNIPKYLNRLDNMAEFIARRPSRRSRTSERILPVPTCRRARPKTSSESVP
jgi:hypothetical protein